VRPDFAELSIIFVAIVPGIDSVQLFLYAVYDAMFLFPGYPFRLTHARVVSDIAAFTPLYIW